jgi:hypothetical protein
MRELIDKAGMFEMLLKALPGAAEGSSAHLEDAEGDDLSYLGSAVFAREVVRLYKLKKVDSFPAVFSTIERLLLEGTEDVKGLITVGFIESLQNIYSWTSPQYSVFEPWLEPNTLAAWREIEAIWQGKSSLADVIRAEMKQE